MRRTFTTGTRFFQTLHINYRRFRICDRRHTFSKKIGQDKPIAYTSRTLSDSERKFHTYEKEALGIVYSVQHFRPYLYGRRFTLVTDHKPLVWFQNSKDPCSRVTRWRYKLAEYDFDVVYKAFEKVSMDIVGPLLITQKLNEYILTIQDNFTKYSLAIPLPNSLTSTIADARVKKFISIFGLPRVILTDQGKNLLSNLIRRLAKIFRIRQFGTAAFHPQSNGSLERSHHVLSEYLKQFFSENSEWDDWIEYWIFRVFAKFVI